MNVPRTRKIAENETLAKASLVNGRRKKLKKKRRNRRDLGKILLQVTTIRRQREVRAKMTGPPDYGNLRRIQVQTMNQRRQGRGGIVLQKTRSRDLENQGKIRRVKMKEKPAQKNLNEIQVRMMKM